LKIFDVIKSIFTVTGLATDLVYEYDDTICAHRYHLVLLCPNSDTHYCHPTVGRRLHQPRHCSKGARPMPNAVYCCRFYF